MATAAAPLSCPSCAVAVPASHPYSWCSACGAALPADVTAHLNNAYTNPMPPMMVALREDSGPSMEAVHEAVAALLAPPHVCRTALLLTTILLFAGVQVLGGTSLAGVLTLVGVMFFHESGHYVAMRAFGYQNVRMLFIPFFGAAVSSPTSGTAAWKEGVVLLAGPAPGILLGAALLVGGVATGARWMFDTASLTMALNLFNLLPLGPLDGGQLFRLTLFSRARWLEVGFLALSGLALAAIAFWGQAWLLAWLALAVAGTARHRYRQRAVAQRLLRDHPDMPRDLAELTPEHQRVLYAYALEALPNPTKKDADEVAGAMRTLLRDVTPPPSWLTSVVLLMAWFVIGVIAMFGVGATSLPEASWADRACPNMGVTARFPSEPAASAGDMPTQQGPRAFARCGAAAEGTGTYVIFRVGFDQAPDRAAREAVFPVLATSDAVDQMDGGRYTARVEYPDRRVWMRFIFDGATAYQLVAEGGDQLEARRFLQSLRLR